MDLVSTIRKFSCTYNYINSGFSYWNEPLMAWKYNSLHCHFTQISLKHWKHWSHHKTVKGRSLNQSRKWAESATFLWTAVVVYPETHLVSTQKRFCSFGAEWAVRTQKPAQEKEGLQPQGGKPQESPSLLASVINTISCRQLGCDIFVRRGTFKKLF